MPRRGIGITSIGKLHDHAGKKNVPLLDVFANAHEVDGVNPKTADKAVALANMLKHYRSAFLKGKGMARLLAELIEEIAFQGLGHRLR